MRRVSSVRAWLGAISGAVLGLALVSGLLALMRLGPAAPRPGEARPGPAEVGAEPTLLYLGLLVAPVAAALGGAYGWRLGAGLPLRFRTPPEADSPPTPPTSLVIGYGNTLRRDDGAGVLVAETIGRMDLPAVTTHAVHQLGPELAEAIAAADRVIFVDARPAAPDAITQALPLAPASASTPGPPLRHTGDPSLLLALARDLFGRCPERCWLVTVPAVDLEFGEQISPTAEQGVRDALSLISSLIRQSNGLS